MWTKRSRLGVGVICTSKGCEGNTYLWGLGQYFDFLIRAARSEDLTNLYRAEGIPRDPTEPPSK